MLLLRHGEQHAVETLLVVAGVGKHTQHGGDASENPALETGNELLILTSADMLTGNRTTWCQMLPLEKGKSKAPGPATRTD